MRKKKVLVIDDDEMNLQIAKMILERKLPCEVICADNGIEGLDLLRQQHFSLILLDIMMPNFDGIETLQEIRRDASIKDVPIMMLTASSDVENIQKVALLGVTDYIKKPFMPVDLINRVGQKLAQERYEGILLFGDDEEILQEMRTIIEDNFPHEALTATSIPKAQKILNETEINLIITDANVKLIRGIKFLSFLASDEELSKIPFAVAAVANLIDLVEKINLQDAGKISDKSPIIEEVAKSAVILKDKNKFANAVTTLIGYDLNAK